MKDEEPQPNVYPKQYEKYVMLKDRTKILLRPLKHTDIDLWPSWYYSLSSVSKFYRFFNIYRQLTPEIIEEEVHIDYVNRFALVAILTEDMQEEMVGEARYRLDPPPDSATIAIAVLDFWQGMGLGTKMLLYLLQIMLKRNIKKIHADISLKNGKMLRIMQESGFKITKKRAHPGVLCFDFYF